MPLPQPSPSASLSLVVNDEPLRVLPAPPLPTLLEEQLEALRSFFDSAPTEPTSGGLFYRKLLANYYRELIAPDASVLEIGCGSGHLLELLPNRDLVGVDISEKQIAAAQGRIPHGEFYVGAAEDLELERKFDVIIISETLNYAADVQQIFERLHAVSHAGTRLILNFHSGLWRPLWSLGSRLGLRAAHPPCNWLSSADVRNILGLAGWEVIKQQGCLLLPLPCFGFEKIVNRYLAPVLSQLGLTTFQVARPIQHSLGEKSVSVIIPARNEAGNIEAA
nr:class I SAM-dependent methyltransferase [Verrucomicrobiota bacterium]